MGVTGFEVNVLRRNKTSGLEEAVPAYHSYNHHYSPNILSSAAAMKVDAFGQPIGVDRGHGKMLMVELRADAEGVPPGARLIQSFVHGNGQEHRQIFHGAASGYVQPIYAPDRFVLNPMQISMNDGTGRKGPSGLLPKFSRDVAPPNAPYSPLLECPCTTRITKQLGQASSLVEGQCANNLLQGDCFAAAATSLGFSSIASNKTTSDATMPAGCMVSRTAAGVNKYNVVFNTNATSKVPCQGMAGRDPARAHLSGVVSDLLDIAVDVDGTKNLVTLTLSGPAQYWFGAGFGGSKMADLPYAIIVDGHGDVTERKLADHDPGTLLQSSLKVLNQTTLNGVRTVVLQRALLGATADHYSFSATVATINIVNALGSTVDLQQHTKRGAISLLLFPVDTTAACLCSSGGGTINGIPYNADCKSEPLSDLLRDNNPTCQVSSYVGGLACCIHGQFLLDADQTPPPFVDEVFFRFRFYYEAYDLTKHHEMNHVEWAQNGCDSGSGGPNSMACSHIEFDVVKGVGSHEGPDVQIFESTFPARGMLATSCSMEAGQCFDGSKVGPGGFKLVMAATHCHAPNCLRQELINVDSGETLCLTKPVHGQSEEIFDEAGYLFAPPCTWGTPQEGYLPPPVLFPNTTLKMVTAFNSTYSHPGQMGIWQMKAAYVD
jgi:hypothetical protein